MSTYYLRPPSDARQKFIRPASGANEPSSHSSRSRRSQRVTDSQSRMNFGESRDASRVDRSAAAAGAAGADRAPGLSKVHNSSSPAVVEIFDRASFLRVRSTEAAPMESKGGRRKEVTELSNASRRRLMELLAKVDLQHVPVFVTLTYPNAFPGEHEVFKRHLDNFGQRLRRRWPSAAFIWKLEFQTRKSGANQGKVAPHYHLFLYNVPLQFPFKVEKRNSYSVRRVKRDNGNITVVERVVGDEWESASSLYLAEEDNSPDSFDSLKAWVSRTWYDVVGSRDGKHFKAGTRVEALRTVRAAFAYAAKRYIAKKEQTPQVAGKPGRFWGVVGRQSLPLGQRELVELDGIQAAKLRRTVRRYRRANTRPEKRKYLRWNNECLTVFCDASVWLARLPEIVGLGASALLEPGNLFANRLQVCWGAIQRRLGSHSRELNKTCDFSTWLAQTARGD